MILFGKAKRKPMPYGYFDDAAREYVITDPATPVKWINYIGTLAFGGFVDQIPRIRPVFADLQVEPCIPAA